MEGQIQYNSLDEAIIALNQQAQNLDDPIDTYMRQQSQIGEAGSAAWGGTAAIRVIPVLSAIKLDIINLQTACKEFADNAGVTLENTLRADAEGIKNVEGVKNA